MSVNNQIIIYRNTAGDFSIKEIDVDSGKMIQKIGEAAELEEAIKKANKYMKEDEIGVEYGLRIQI